MGPSRIRSIASLFVVLTLALCVGAAAPIASTAVDAVYTVKTATVLVLSEDTLAAATTRDTLSASFSPEANWEYVLAFKTFTGTGADSIKVAVWVEALDDAGTRLSRVGSVDTITDSAGEQVLLPIHSGIVGTTYRIIVGGVAGNGGIVNPTDSVYVYKRRPYMFSGR